MSDLSIFSSKLSLNSKSLKEFDESIRFFRGKAEVARNAEVDNAVSKLLNVIVPITEIINEEFPKTTAINEQDVISILKEWHNIDWFAYKEGILSLSNKLKSDKFQISNDELRLLGDIADALDAECQKLFRRMGER